MLLNVKTLEWSPFRYRIPALDRISGDRESGPEDAGPASRAWHTPDRATAPALRYSTTGRSTSLLSSLPVHGRPRGPVTHLFIFSLRQIDRTSSCRTERVPSECRVVARLRDGRCPGSRAASGMNAQ